MPYFVDTDSTRQTAQLLHVRAGAGLFRFAILHAGREDHAADGKRRGGRTRGHAHDIYHVVLYERGDSQFWFEGRKHAAARGVLALASPGQRHEFGPCAPGGMLYDELTFALTTEAGVPLRLAFGELLSLYCGVPFESVAFPIRLAEPATVRLLGLFGDLERAFAARGGAYWFGVFRAVLDMMAFLAREVFSCEVAGGGGDPIDVARLQIERRYADRISVRALAGESGLSLPYFCRAFKARHGASPLRYQQDLRMRAAENLLLTTGLRCKEIASRTGFSDEYFFSKVFKRRVGVTPTAYRRGRRADEGSSSGVDCGGGASGGHPDGGGSG